MFIFKVLTYLISLVVANASIAAAKFRDVCNRDQIHFPPSSIVRMMLKQSYVQ